MTRCPVEIPKFYISYFPKFIEELHVNIKLLYLISEGIVAHIQ